MTETSRPNGYVIPHRNVRSRRIKFSYPTGTLDRHYVKGDLVLRLKRTISDATLTKIRTGFTDVIKMGSFELTNALPEESEEPTLAALPRLKFSQV